MNLSAVFHHTSVNDLECAARVDEEVDYRLAATILLLLLNTVGLTITMDGLLLLTKVHFCPLI